MDKKYLVSVISVLKAYFHWNSTKREHFKGKMKLTITCRNNQSALKLTFVPLK